MYTYSLLHYVTECCIIICIWLYIHFWGTKFGKKHEESLPFAQDKVIIHGSPLQAGGNLLVFSGQISESEAFPIGVARTGIFWWIFGRVKSNLAPWLTKWQFELRSTRVTRVTWPHSRFKPPSWDLKMVSSSYDHQRIGNTMVSQWTGIPVVES